MEHGRLKPGLALHSPYIQSEEDITDQATDWHEPSVHGVVVSVLKTTTKNTHTLISSY